MKGILHQKHYSPFEIYDIQEYKTVDMGRRNQF